MPRTAIDLGNRLERLGVLDEDGNLDAALDPGVPVEDLRRLFRFMLLTRAYDDRRLKLQRQGRIGTFAPAEGQEAAQLGSAYAVERDDWIVPSFREVAVGLYRGMGLEADLLFCAGFDEGIQIGPESHDLPICIPVGSQIPHAAGLAWGLKLQGSDRVVLCYFGDGATSEGDFHEALNFASLHQVPLVLFCQNNQWAISVPVKDQTHSRTLAQKAVAYDVPSLVVDGNDILAVIAATREAVARARQGRGPTLIEAVTYRMGVHTTADDPTLYRGSAEVELWARRDPLARLRAHLQNLQALTDEEEKAWSEECAKQVSAAVAAFEAAAAKADPLRMFDHLYAAPMPELVAQHRELQQRLKQRPQLPEAETSRSEEEGRQEGGPEDEKQGHPPSEGTGSEERGGPPSEGTEDEEQSQAPSEGTEDEERGQAPSEGTEDEERGQAPSEGTENETQGEAPPQGGKRASKPETSRSDESAEEPTEEPQAERSKSRERPRRNQGTEHTRIRAGESD